MLCTPLLFCVMGLLHLFVGDFCGLAFGFDVLCSWLNKVEFSHFTQLELFFYPSMSDYGQIKLSFLHSCPITNKYICEVYFFFYDNYLKIKLSMVL